MNKSLWAVLTLAARAVVLVMSPTAAASNLGEGGRDGKSLLEYPHEVTVEALYSVPHPTNVELSPDGSRVLLTLQKPSSNGFLRGESNLWLIDIAAGDLQQVATANKDGQYRSGTTFLTRPHAKWSRDGQRVLWLDSDGQKDQLWSYSLSTSEVQQVTSGSGSVVDFAETPDGSAIALVKVAASLRRAQVFARAEAYFFSDYPEGWWDPSRSDPINIELLDVRSGAITTVASNLPHAIELSWDAGGERLLFVPRIDSWGGMIVAPLIYNRTTVKLTQAVQPESTLRQPTWSADGKRLAWVEHVLYSHASREPKEGIQFTGGLFSHLPILKIGELNQDRVEDSHVLVDETALVQPGLPIIWNASDEELFAGFSEKARSRVYAVDPVSGARRLVTPEEFHVLDYDISADGRTLVGILTNANTPPEVYVGDIGGGQFRRLTSVSQELPFKPGNVLPVHWRSGDDRFDVHGWLVTPPDYDPGRRYPMVVEIHGGPAGTIMDDFWRVHTENVPPAILASRGYLVLLPNPRGDSGYTAEYAKALVGNYMTGDVDQDILPGVDAMVTAGIANPEKLAVSGFSAGATRVAWAISHSNKFKAASLSDGAVNHLSYWGQALPYNTGWLEFYLEGTPNERMDEYIKRSPITYASRIETPVLMRFAYGNAKLWNAPATAQGKELQAALYMQGIPTEIQIEPFAVHSPRTVDSLQLWVEINLAWFDHYLLGKPLIRPRPCEMNSPLQVAMVSDVCVLAEPVARSKQ